jgi:glyoxylase-like metal-dependent hydrolase (beta-lactamase superfamily II)
MKNGGKIITSINTGYCTSFAKIAHNRSTWSKTKFHTRAFLVHTEKHGNILFDTGYSNLYHRNVAKIYDLIIPATPLAIDLSFLDISYIIPSHYHGDHVAGLKNLVDIPWIYNKTALDKLTKMGWLRSLKNGFFNSLIPPIPHNSIPFYQELFTKPFLGSTLKSLEILEGIHIVNLPGHALGHIGLYYKNKFLIGDAVWSALSIYDGILPSKIGLLLQHNTRQYIHTLSEIHKIAHKHPEIEILPCHTMEIL